MLENEMDSLSFNPVAQRFADGLYDPETEHGSCGVGFLADLGGRKTHDIVLGALRILENLEHRGASGYDPDTGDGAGILVQMPDCFLREALADDHITLPEPGDYGAGIVFLPPEEGPGGMLRVLAQDVVRAEGQTFIGWRKVPTRSEETGQLARQTEPSMWQIFIGRNPSTPQGVEFERKLYVIRKQMENRALTSGVPQAHYFYVVSLSSRTLVYKGLLLARQMLKYYSDLSHPLFESALALVHQRYSTNTFPSWELAQPFRFLCHNGEINTLRGNLNWMAARQRQMSSPLFGKDVEKIKPIIRPGLSDSAALDSALELLCHTGRSLPHSIAMLIPEAWEKHRTMSDTKRAFYEYHSTIMEPWDGPASLAFCDGRVLGAVLDRNGLRPSRYTVTKDGLVIMASETGVLEIAPEQVLEKGRLQPGRMFLVNLEEHRIVPDEEVKEGLAHRRPYRIWLKDNLVDLKNLPEIDNCEKSLSRDDLLRCQRAFGYSLEDLRVILGPMAQSAKEPVGSMGNDTPPAVLSDKNPLLYGYFKQLFAQVTNPPLDAIREELVTSTRMTLGAAGNIFEETASHAQRLRIEEPILTKAELLKIKNLSRRPLRAATIDATFPAETGSLFPASGALEAALHALCREAEQAVKGGATILVLSDRGLAAERAAIPALLAVSAVHHHLIRRGRRTLCSLVVESGEPREVHHFALLFAYGASAVCPYLAFETVEQMAASKQLGLGISGELAVRNYIDAVDKGVVKILSKMGISTLHGYMGAQIFEAVGLKKKLVDRYFTGTPSRIEGVGLDVLEAEALFRHRQGFAPGRGRENRELSSGGRYAWRRGEERHLNNPLTISALQNSVRENSRERYKKYAALINEQSREQNTLRGLLEFIPAESPLPIEEVEPAREIVKRFKTGAMSFGSLSFEAHANLAVAMNRIGAKSNSGEGGEDPLRFRTFADENTRMSALGELSPWVRENLKPSDSLRSSIKQVASGRFGVTSEYLVNASELQIKMAQGAKPGEGGQLPGHKVDEWIAAVRHSTPGVQLISPPPHHDIYSIEDLAQLIYDLKCANREARVSVKLVSEVGVGTIAAGVAKGKADLVLISGCDGGTGASPLSSIQHAGLPWELGLAETQQVLVMNNLRSRIVVETDGQLKTGRDVAVACLLGAEEFGFSTAPLIASGCIMMRKCHLNTCPVGVATQDPELRRKFAGKPEHVINFMFFVAEEMREIMALLGFRTVDEMVGRVDKLDARKAVEHWKSCGLDLRPLLRKPEVPPEWGTHHCQSQDHGIEKSIDVTTLLELARPALECGERVYEKVSIRNIHRTVGTITGSEITKRWGNEGLPEDTLHFKFSGSAGQSFGAFIPRGMTMEVEGDANDYFGKGLSGGRLIIYPPKASTFKAEENILVGNVAFYGATAGEAFIRGVAGERFCVRNSGLRAVVEGVGDHGCEYMTGGVAVILGATGRNFAAGMSGGIAYVLDEAGDFVDFRLNAEMVEAEDLSLADERELKSLIERHVLFTESSVGRRLLSAWDYCLPLFLKIIPTEYRLAMERRGRSRAEERFAEQQTAAEGARWAR